MKKTREGCNVSQFPEIVRSLRRERGLTQQQLSEALGVSPQAISRWENGAALPDVQTLPAIAACFDVSVDVLLGLRQPAVRQKLMYFQFAWQESADKINTYLEDGWRVREMHTHPVTDGNHPEGVVLLEKTIL